MLFASFLGCIEAVARLNDQATIGNIQKMNTHLTVGQVKRCLTQLEKEGYMHHKHVPYGKTGKAVYYLSNRCVTNLDIVATQAELAGYISEGTL